MTCQICGLPWSQGSICYYCQMQKKQSGYPKSLKQRPKVDKHGNQIFVAEKRDN